MIASEKGEATRMSHRLTVLLTIAILPLISSLLAVSCAKKQVATSTKMIDPELAQKLDELL